MITNAKKIKQSYKVGDLVTQVENLKNYSRLTILSASNVYKQGIRTLEREKAYVYFKALENEMITAEVANIGERFLTLSLGFNVTSILMLSELLPNDSFKIGDHIRVYVKRVEQTTKEPKVIVSRTERNLVTRLLENYIPEIKSGIIEIKGIARDPGDRTKIAIYSNSPDVDAIGSCIGKNGMRIANILAELGNEKVDIIRYSDDLPTYVAEALSPAKVLSVTMEDERSCRVTVLPEQLSLAIGKEGQNAKLVARLTGCKIDIKA